MTNELTIYKNKNKAIVPYVKKKNLKILVKRIPVGPVIAAPVFLSHIDNHTILARKHNSDWLGGCQGASELEPFLEVHAMFEVQDLDPEALVRIGKAYVEVRVGDPAVAALNDLKWAELIRAKKVSKRFYENLRDNKLFWDAEYQRFQDMLKNKRTYPDWPCPSYPERKLTEVEKVNDALIKSGIKKDYPDWVEVFELIKELLPGFEESIQVGTASYSIALGDAFRKQSLAQWLSADNDKLHKNELWLAVEEAAMSKQEAAIVFDTLPILKLAEMVSKACPVVLTVTAGAVAVGALWGQGPGLSKDSWEAGLKTLVNFIGENSKTWSYAWPKLKRGGQNEQHWQYTLLKLWSSANANYVKILKHHENTFEDIKLFRDLKVLITMNRECVYRVKPFKFKSLSYYKNMGNLDTVKYVINLAKEVSDILNESKLENKRDHKNRFATALCAVLKVLNNLLKK